MNTAKHTPGPWVINAHDTGMNDSGTIEGNGVVICPEVYGESKARCDANAHLIAAAPAMYEALKAIQEKISGADVLFDPNPQWEGEQARYDAAQEALFLVDQALAQAEGK